MTKAAEYNRRWRERHPTYDEDYRNKNREAIKQSKREWASKNRAESVRLMREWRKKHSRDPKYRERCGVAFRKWRKTNYEKWLVIKHAYEARKRKAPGCFTGEQWLNRLKYYGYRCRYCNKDLTQETPILEHFIPLSRGGSNWPSNLVPSCKSCNSSKKAKTGWEFISALRTNRCQL
jgi:5-methylcytosine-specific restriction endonuclease McrA